MNLIEVGALVVSAISVGGVASELAGATFAKGEERRLHYRCALLHAVILGWSLSFAMKHEVKYIESPPPQVEKE